MIASLTGILQYKNQEKLIVNVNGVGYEVCYATPDFHALPETGAEIFFHIYTAVREDALILYGFQELSEKEIFLILLGVSGVGPKLAVNIVSSISPLELSRAIVLGNTARLIQISGVGKKSAERICLELKDKVQHFANQTVVPGQPSSGPENTVVSDAVSALVNLGYPEMRARESISGLQRRMGNDFAVMGLEEIIRLALRSLA